LRYISAGEYNSLVRHDEDALIELAKVFGIGGSEWDLEGNRDDPDEPSVELVGTLTNTYVVSTKDIVFVPTSAGIRSPDAQYQYITQLMADVLVPIEPDPEAPEPEPGDPPPVIEYEDEPVHMLVDIKVDDIITSTTVDGLAFTIQTVIPFGNYTVGIAEAVR
jgi:hypothetical protein